MASSLHGESFGSSACRAGNLQASASTANAIAASWSAVTERDDDAASLRMADFTKNVAVRSDFHVAARVAMVSAHGCPANPPDWCST